MQTSVCISLLVLKSIRRSDSPDIFFLISLIDQDHRRKPPWVHQKNHLKKSSSILLTEEILHKLIGSLSYYPNICRVLFISGGWTGFFHPLCKLHGYGSCKEFHVWWTFGDELRDTAGRWLLCIGWMVGFVKGWKFGCIHMKQGCFDVFQSLTCNKKSKTHYQTKPGWWFQCLWTIWVKMGISPNRGEHEKKLNHHPEHVPSLSCCTEIFTHGRINIWYLRVTVWQCITLFVGFCPLRNNSCSRHTSKLMNSPCAFVPLMDEQRRFIFDSTISNPKQSWKNTGGFRIRLISCLDKMSL